MPTDIRDLYQFAKQGFAEGQQNRFDLLAGQAYGAPREQRQDILNKAAMINPMGAAQVGQAMQSQDEAKYQRAAKMALFLAKAPEQARPSIYRQILPELQRTFPGDYPPEYTPEVGQMAESIVQSFGGVGEQVPSGYQEFDMLAKDAKLSPEDRALAARRALYLDRRPSNAAIAYKEVKGPDGRTRLVAFDPNEPGAETIGGGPTYGSMGGDGDAQPSAMDVAGTLQRFGGTITSGYRNPTKNARVGGVPNSQHMAGDAFDIVMPQPLKARAAEYGRQNGFEVIDEGDHLHFERPPQQAGRGGNPFASRLPEDEAAAKKSAELAAQEAADRGRAEFDRQQAGDIAAAQAGGKVSVERGTDTTDRAAALNLYETAMAGLESGLESTVTGPIVGRLPALTAGQQIAQGSVAAMAPVLKQLFRVAGEGTFTDKDQALLLEMVPTARDLPAARAAKIKNIDRIVRAKLRQPPSQKAPSNIDALLEKYR